MKKTMLKEIEVSETVKIGKWEFIVCEHTKKGTVLAMNDFLCNSHFGTSNKYKGANVDQICNEFAEKLEEVVGKENIITHTVDLTADDGRKDYGKIRRNVSVFTANQYRKYVEILDKYRKGRWEWTCTAYSTPRNNDEEWVKFVSPSGFISGNFYSFNDVGVRPFCILKSDIFVS